MAMLSQDEKQPVVPPERQGFISGIIGGIERLLTDPEARAEHDQRFRALAARFGGEYIVDEDLDRSRAVLRLDKGGHEISLSTGTTVMGRVAFGFAEITVVFPERADIRFRAGPEGAFERILNGLFQIRDHFAGESEFDRRFVVTGNDGFRVLAIFADTRLQAAMCREPDVIITTLTDDGLLERAPAGKRAARIRIAEEVRDPERLATLIEISLLLSEKIGLVNSPEQLPGQM